MKADEKYLRSKYFKKKIVGGKECWVTLGYKDIRDNSEEANLRKYQQEHNIDKDPIISVVASAIRTDFWKKFYGCLELNKIPFECVLVGHVKPNFELPKNVRHIYSEVKPAQCFHIGIKEARGKYIFTSQDDIVFSPNALDKLHILLESKGDKNSYATGRIVTCGIDDKKLSSIKMRKKSGMYFWGKFSRKYIKKKEYCPLLPNGSPLLFHKETYMRLGGFDNRFIGSYKELDFAMRLYEAGGKGLLDMDVLCVEYKDGSIFPEELSGLDSTLFYSWWCGIKDNPTKRYGYDERIPFTRKMMKTEGIVFKNRSEPVKSYVNDDTLILKSQGNVNDKWK